MTDKSHGWGVNDTASFSGAQNPATPAGWYPDPWSAGHHRYWDGATWTSEIFPHGPATAEGAESADMTQPAFASPLGSPDPATAPESVPPPSWAPPTYQAWDPAAPPFAAGAEPAPAELGSKPSRLTSGLGFVALVLSVMLLVGALGILGGYLYSRSRSTKPSAAAQTPGVVPATPPFSVPGPAPSTVPADPAAGALASLVITQADVPAGVTVGTVRRGDQVSPADGTLDLCNGTFPSEALRTARLQVAAFKSAGDFGLSTEAVLYKNPGATALAFDELKSAVANCPSTPVTSPIGLGTRTTHFNAAPDTSWAPPPATVTRQAYDFTSTDDTGATTHSVAVYLRRGRALLGVYFEAPDGPQITVAGQTTIETIANLFATRLAQLPASVVNG